MTHKFKVGDRVRHISVVSTGHGTIVEVLDKYVRTKWDNTSFGICTDPIYNIILLSKLDLVLV